MMRLRSLLFVPGDRPERIKKALGLEVDALILDLEDSVAATMKDEARGHVAAILAEPRQGPRLFVRVNPIDSPNHAGDIEALASTTPDGVVLPKAEGSASVLRLKENLMQRGISAVSILPIATETPAAMFELGTYRSVAGNLAGLTWGAEDLPAAIGAATSREEDGRYTAPYELARSLTLFAASAAGVPAIDTVYPDFRDLDGLANYARRAARDGFSGMMAIHPSQVAAINAAFTPTAEELAQARRIVAAFRDNPGVGALQLDGKMVDAPHVKAAQRILAMAGES